jgi:hypothetical protein
VTIRKHDLRPRDRVPEFVDRATGAGELCISPETWDKWVKDGILPQPDLGFPESSPRWCWEDVRNKLRGVGNASGSAIIAAAERLRSHGTKARGASETT